jgi:hypothetical protein
MERANSITHTSPVETIEKHRDSATPLAQMPMSDSERRQMLRNTWRASLPGKGIDDRCIRDTLKRNRLLRQLCPDPQVRVAILWRVLLFQLRALRTALRFERCK